MKKIYRFASVILLTSFLIPSIAMASWWNPFSWNIFSWLFHNSAKTETVQIATTTAGVSSSSTKFYCNGQYIENTCSSSNLEYPVCPKDGSRPYCTNNKMSANTNGNYSVVDQKDTILCNGINYTKCRADQKFVCPADGKSDATCDCKNGLVGNKAGTSCITPDASCQESYGQNFIYSGKNDSGGNICDCKSGYLLNSNNACQLIQPQQQTQTQLPAKEVAPIKSGYQICKDTYGNATWDGTSYTSSGGPNCSCDHGYAVSSDGKSCVIAPIVPVKTGYQICNDMNATWDGTSYTSSGGFSCTCNTGYTSGSDGKSCVIVPKATNTMSDYNNCLATAKADYLGSWATACSNSYVAYTQCYQQYGDLKDYCKQTYGGWQNSPLCTLTGGSATSINNSYEADKNRCATVYGHN